jgi:hypothetical protein
MSRQDHTCVPHAGWHPQNPCAQTCPSANWAQSIPVATSGGQGSPAGAQDHVKGGPWQLQARASPSAVRQWQLALMSHGASQLGGSVGHAGGGRPVSHW